MAQTTKEDDVDADKVSSDSRHDEEGVLQDTIPTFQQMQMDVLEFWCQTALKECDSRALYSQRCQGFYEIVEQVGESVADYGRIHNRLQLAMLCADLTERNVTPADDEEENQDDEEDDADISLVQLPAEKWAEYRDTIESVRNKLLRKDANCDDTEPPNGEINNDLESRAKFSIDYDAVMNMLEVCEIVARFRTSLDKLLSSKSSNDRYLLDKVKTAVDDYKNSIQDLQLTSDLSEKLTSFLLADMYKSKPKDLAQHLKDHLYEIMTDVENECGYEQIVRKTHRLLSRWHSHVLTVPKLCRLGYGGFVKRKSTIEDDNVSVSSWGVDEEELKERKQVEEATSEGSEKYMTADDATADPEEANAAFGLSTQPPIPEEIDESAEKEQEEEVDDGDKKPRAKRKKKQQPDQSPTVSRRRSRLKGDEPHGSPHSSPQRKKVPSQAPKSPGMESVVYSEEEVRPPRKEPAIDDMPPPADDDSSESDKEGSSSPPRKKQAVARKPPPAGASSNSELESNRPQKKQAVSQRAPPGHDAPSIARRHPAARRFAKKPTVIEWSDSGDDDDEVPSPSKRSRRSSFGGRQSGGKPGKKQKKRRPFTDEEKEAIRAGVREFGKGKWAEIRLNSDGILMSRTTVNIKDAYRTMENRGEV